MRPKSIALLMLALGCGLVASIGITQVLTRKPDTAAAGDMQQVVVAMQDIPLGDILTPELVKLEQKPKEMILPGSISRIEDIDGRRTRTKLFQGEPILENRLFAKGTSAQGATALIPKGYRVVPVKVDLVSGGGSMIMPGDRVDVMIHLVRDTNREIQETVTRTILQDIKVFAVDDVVDLEKEKEGKTSMAAKTISLLVTPDQAAKLMLATQMGVINLVMRSPEDDQQVANAQARPGELLGVQPKAERVKETLVAPEPSLSDKTKGFLEFLSSIKSKTPADAMTMPKKSESWTMRILKPGEVQDIQFGGEDDKAPVGSPLGARKSMTVAAGKNGDDGAVKNGLPDVTPIPKDLLEEMNLKSLRNRGD
jgi:pilus assembly protein CpaB